MGDGAAPLTGLSETQRAEAMRRLLVLRPHLEDGATLTAAARSAGVSLRTAQRWLSLYRQDSLAGLATKRRRDRGTRRFPTGVVDLVEGLALRRPAPSTAWIHRQVVEVAHREGWAAPSYSTVRSIVRGVDPALRTLAQQGDRVYRETFDLLHRHEAGRPNAIWQADHTQLDLHLVPDQRPWLTVILDDHSRCVAGYSLSLTAPSALHTSLALRQAIWRKPDAGWDICGIPDLLYVDHGSDFTSRHIEQVTAALGIQLVHSAVGRPRGRGKIERFFRTVNQLLISELPGYAPRSRPLTRPGLSLSELEERIRSFFVNQYNRRRHSQTNQAPQQRWNQGGFIPKQAETLETLDLLLATVAKPRVVHRDGIRFTGYRYVDTTLAGYIGEAVTIRYDPRDIAEIRVFHNNVFICRPVCAELADRTVSLKDITTARKQRRRQLRTQIDTRSQLADRYLQIHQPPTRPGKPRPEPPTSTTRLKRYHND